MRLTVCAVFCCVLALPALAQRGGGGHGGGGGHAMGGGGRGGFSGGGFHGGFGGGGLRGGGFRGGGFRGGIGFNRGFGHGFNRGFNRGFGFRNRSFYSPYLWAGFYGGYDNWGWDYPYYYGDSYAYPYSYAPDSIAYGNYDEPPVVVINQGYQPEQPVPVVREYPPPPAPRPPADETPLYLIAFKDGIIRAALAYWAEGDQLHYVTMDREMKQVPLNTLDRELSTRLNHERHVSFSLPR